MRSHSIKNALIVSALVLTAPSLVAQEAPDAPEPEVLTPDQDQADDGVIEARIARIARFLEILSALDEEPTLTGNGAVFSIEEVEVNFVFDLNAGRLRLVAPVRPAGSLDADDLKRLMQANFDTALDARYAIAQDMMWSSFIHPISSLSDEDFISAIVQTVSLVQTYGTTYSSGGLTFGGGDSAEELEEFIRDRLAEQLEDI